MTIAHNALPSSLGEVANGLKALNKPNTNPVTPLAATNKSRDEVVFGTRWVDINKGDETKPFYRSRLVVQEYKRQADWSFFTANLLICATIDELPNGMGQPVAWTEPVVLMLIDVRRAHFYSTAP